MAIAPILKVRSGAFEPHAVQVMSRAFDEVCLALTLNHEDAHARDIVAVRIIELARRGLRSSPLCDVSQV